MKGTLSTTAWALVLAAIIAGLAPFEAGSNSGPAPGAAPSAPALIAASAPAAAQNAAPAPAAAQNAASAPAGSQGQSISGTVTIDGRAFHHGIAVWADSLSIAFTDSSGSYLIGGLDDGTYTVRAWSSNCLVRTIATVTIAGGDMSGVDGVLAPGDLVSDGRIDLLDAGKLLQHFGSREGESGWDPILDLNADGVIDSLDIALLMSNWKESHAATPPSLQVIYPHTGVTWYRGQKGVSIRWAPGVLGGEVSIVLLRDSQPVDTISAATANNGFFEWHNVSLTLEPYGGYRILLQTESGQSHIGEYFAIRIPIVLFNPDGTTRWTPGIRDGKVQWWDQAEAGGTVSLYLYKGDSLAYEIASGLPNAPGSYFYYWTVPADLEFGADYRVLLRQDQNPDYSDWSDSFHIWPPLTVLMPSGAVWYQGQLGIAVAWETAGLSGNVRISLRNDYQEVAEIVPATENSGLYADYTFLVPDLWVGANQIHVSYNEVLNGSGRISIRRPPSTPDYGWVRISPRTSLNDIAMTDARTATVIGDLGRIMRTTDAGATWTLQESGTYQNLTRVSFHDSNIGTVVGYDGVVLRTENGGVDWVRQPSGVPNNLSHVFHLDAMNVVAVGKQPWGIVIRTRDGGATWEIVQRGPGRDLEAIACADDMNWIVAGTGDGIFATADGGQTWALIYEGLPGFDMWIYDIRYYDAATYGAIGGFSSYMMAHSAFLKSVDGGLSWEVDWLQPWDAPFGTGLDFADASRGVAVGTDYSWWTSDGGTTWQAQALRGRLRKVAVTGDLEAMAVGENGIIKRSAGPGEPWLDTGALAPNIYGLDHLADETAVAAGQYGHIWRTVDGGVHWTQQPSGTSNRLECVSFAGADTGLVLGYGGTIIGTLDGGLTWTAQTSGTTAWLFGVDHANGLQATAVGGNGTILTTGDGGETWSSRPSGTTATLRAVSYGDSGRVTAVGDGGLILRSADGGLTWSAQPSGTTSDLYGVAFREALSGIVVGSGGVVLRTSDGGETWTGLDLSDMIGFATGLAVAWGDENTVTITAAGAICRSSDGGSTWVRQGYQGYNTLNAVSFFGPLTGIIVGDAGTVLVTATGGE